MNVLYLNWVTDINFIKYNPLSRKHETYDLGLNTGYEGFYEKKIRDLTRQYTTYTKPYTRSDLEFQACRGVSYKATYKMIN